MLPTVVHLARRNDECERLKDVWVLDAVYHQALLYHGALQNHAHVKETVSQANLMVADSTDGHMGNCIEVDELERTICTLFRQTGGVKPWDLHLVCAVSYTGPT